MRATGAKLPPFLGFGHPPRKILDPPLDPHCIIQKRHVGNAQHRISYYQSLNIISELHLSGALQAGGGANSILFLTVHTSVQADIFNLCDYVFFQWSIDLLGQISSKYSSKRGVPHTGSLNELLQFWMNCKPTMVLIEITSECFASM